MRPVSTMSSVIAEWDMTGGFIGASIVGIEDLSHGLPLSALLDEFSIALVIRRERLSRGIVWPRSDGRPARFHAHFSVDFGADGEPSRIVMSAIERDDAPQTALDRALAAAHGHIATLAGGSGPFGKTDSAEAETATATEPRMARSVAAAMLALAGDIRKLSEAAQSAFRSTPSPTNDDEERSVPDRSPCCDGG